MDECAWWGVSSARARRARCAPQGRATQVTAAPDAPLRSILVGCCAIDSARSDMIRQLRIRSLCVARAGPAKRKGPSSSRALWAFVFIHILNANEPETRDRTYESTTLDGRARSIRCGRAASPHRARPRASDAPRAGRRPAGGGAVGSSRSTAVILRDTVRHHTNTNPRTREGSYTTRQRNRPSAASKRRRSSRFRACAVLHSLPRRPPRRGSTFMAHEIASSSVAFALDGYVCSSALLWSLAPFV